MSNIKESRISRKAEGEILSRLEARTSEYKEIRFFEFGRWSFLVAKVAYFLGVNPLRVLVPTAVILAVLLALVFREKLVYLVSIFQGGF